MKGSISRQSDRSEQRYSGLRHIQGGMITDADLNESATLNLRRDEAQGAAFAGSGVPAQGGMIQISDKGEVFVQDGTVFAEGKQGHFTMPGFGEPTNSLEVVQKLQADLQAEGDLPSMALAYMDLWERPVFALQDPYLADPGLHGAETSFRTRTMTQLKLLPLRSLPEDARDLEKLIADPAFRRKGNATVTLSKSSTVLAAADCDPCADQISVEKTPPNALFRIEIVDVTLDAAGRATGVELAWSYENGEVIESFDRASAISKKEAVYQLFNEASETQIGYLSPKAYKPVRSGFTRSLASNKVGGVTYDSVRRWDGHANVPFDSAEEVTGETPKAAKSNGKVIKVQTEFFTVNLDVTGRTFVVGDYWQVEMRRYAAEDEQLTLNGGPFDGPSGPRGPDHYFCPLFFTEGDDFLPLPDMLRRSLSFPTLSDIPADHVSYDADPKCDLMNGALTVQEGLDAVCDINAGHVAFTPPQEGCETLEGTNNVREALIALCETDVEKQFRLMMRSMMDWGVVCGLKLEQLRNSVSLSAGIVHDRNGILHEVDAIEFDVRKLNEKNLWDPKLDLGEIQEKFGEICLALAVRDDEQHIVLCSPDAAQNSEELTLAQRIERCLKTKGSLAENEFFEKLSDEDRVVLTKVHVSFRGGLEPQDGLGLNKEEFERARKLMEMLIEDFAKRVDRNDQQRLKKALANVEREIENLKQKMGPGQQELLYISMIYATLMKLDDELRVDCLCDNAVPSCSDAFEGYTLVPVGCLEFHPETLKLGELILTHTCMMCCRKQAQTWKSQRYYFGDQIGRMLSQFKELCCEDKLNPDGNIGLQIEDWLEERGPAPWDAEQSGDMWPPAPTYLPKSKLRGYSLNAAHRGFGGWRKGRVPSILDIKGRKTQEAQEILKRGGFNLVETVDIEGISKAVELSKARGPLLNRYPQKGDHVVLLTHKELAVEFVVIHQERRKPLRRFDRIPLDIIKIDPRILKEVPAKDPTKGVTIKDFGRKDVIFDPKLAADLIKKNPNLIKGVGDVKKGPTKAQLAAQKKAEEARKKELAAKKQADARRAAKLKKVADLKAAEVAKRRNDMAKKAAADKLAAAKKADDLRKAQAAQKALASKRAAQKREAARKAAAQKAAAKKQADQRAAAKRAAAQKALAKKQADAKKRQQAKAALKVQTPTAAQLRAMRNLQNKPKK